MMKQKLWGGRFAASLSNEIESFSASIHFDNQLAYEDVLGSLAHVNCLKKAELVTVDEHDKMTRGLREIAQKIKLGKLSYQLEDEDIHMNIEKMLYDDIGEAALKLHTARSRNDQVALDLHLYLRQAILDLVHDLVLLQGTFLELAQLHKDIILPGYTHLQRAQPITLARHWLTYVAMLARDIERLEDSFKRVNQCPLGAGALAGSSFKLDKEALAKELAFDGIYLSTMDAVSDRDFIVEFLSAGSLIMIHLSRLSEELILWASHEFNFIHLDDGFSTGSSMMPQKKNPDLSELIRAKSGRVCGSLFTLLMILKGLPLTYNKDMQEDKEPLFDAVKTLRACLSVSSPLLKSLKINRSVMQEACQTGFMNATALAEFLVKKGLPFRVSHEIVGKMVKHCLEKKCNLHTLSLKEMQQFSGVIDEEVYDAINIVTIVNQSKEEIEREINIRQSEMIETQSWLRKKNLSFNQAIANLMGIIT